LSSYTIHKITLTTSTGGAATDTLWEAGYVPNGVLITVYYEYVDADTGADLVLSDTLSGVPLFTATDLGTADALWHPKAQNDDDAGAAITGEYQRIACPGRQWTATIAAGGNAKTLHLYFVMRED
jgi:hypothetical protein